jgi:HEAT repeat protein
VNDSQTKTMAMVGATALVGVVSFMIGRWTAPEAEPKVVTQTKVIREPGAKGPGVQAPPPGEHSAHDGHDHGPGAHDAGGGASGGGGPMPQIPKPGTPLNLDKVFTAAKEAFEAPDDHHINEAATAAAGELEMRLLTDPAALEEALRRFPDLTGQAELEVLAAVLGRVRDPIVEQTALRYAIDRTNPVRRAAALDILDALDTPHARPVALDVLDESRDLNVRRAALRAVPEPQGASQDEAQRVVESLTQILANDTDSELRRRSAVMLGTWARNQQDLQPVINHLMSDSSVDVRAGAAFGLELSRSKDPAVINALTRAVLNGGEDPLVRENAWKALGAISPLPPAAAEAYKAFQQERDALGEASGG